MTKEIKAEREQLSGLLAEVQAKLGTMALLRGLAPEHSKGPSWALFGNVTLGNS